MNLLSGLINILRRKLKLSFFSIFDIIVLGDKMISDSIVSQIKEVVKECGKTILNADRKNMKIEEKEGIANIVTNYDVQVQNILKEKLLLILPEAKFMGEENEEIQEETDDLTFVVDPIDGTNNFARDLGLSAISVGLLQNKKPILGICYNPYRDELFEAQKGKGSYLNGKKIHVSDLLLKDGLVACGNASYYVELKDKSIEIQNKLIKEASCYRRLGCAVIEICSIASGRTEAYFELKLMPWDFTAASIILTEAGGKITTLEGKEINYFKPSSILASNDKEDYLKYI